MTTRRRWSFTLRTLFIVLTAACIAGGWSATQLSWIRQRHALIADGASSSSWTAGHGVDVCCEKGHATAPWPLRLFGEKGYYGLFAAWPESSPEIARARRLFPETWVTGGQPKGSLATRAGGPK